MPNLSGEVLGFQNKMNQLKIQETRIRQVSREAEEFVSLQAVAKQTIGQISEIATAAAAQKTSLQASSDEVAGILVKVTEQGQKISSVAAQVQQHEITAAQQLANSKQAAADTEAIANKSKELQTEIEASRNNLQDLAAKTQELLTSTQTAASGQLSEFSTRYENLASSTQSQITALMTKVDATIAEQTSALNTKAETTSAALQRSGTELENKVTQFIADSSSHLTQAEATHETRLADQLRDFVTKGQTQMAEQSEAFNIQTTTLAGEAKESIEAGKAGLTKLVTELGELEGRIRESVERATGYTLFHSFQKRQLDIARSKRFWGYTLGIVVVISLIASGFFIWSLQFVQAYNAAFYLKLSVSVPLIYAIAFCNVQYSRERRLEEEYAFKSTISISLDPYQKLVEKLVDKTKPEELAKYTAFIIDSVSRVFTSPTEQIFETPGDKNSAEKLIKACGEFIEPVVKGLKR